MLRGCWIIDLRCALSWRPDPKLVRSILRLGLPAALQRVAMNLRGLALIRFIGSLDAGPEAQAAFAVGYGQLFAFVSWTAGRLQSSAKNSTSDRAADSNTVLLARASTRTRRGW